MAFFIRSIVVADTLDNIDVPPNDWIDLYTLSGIDVGIKIAVENVGNSDIYLAEQATKPPTDHDAFNIAKRKGLPMTNDPGSSGAWAFSPNAVGKVNVRIVI